MFVAPAWQGRIYICIALVAAASVLCALSMPAAAQDSCPANSDIVSEKIVGNKRIVECECSADYTDFNGNCRPVAEVKRVLVDRIQAANRGMNSVISSLKYEAHQLDLERLKLSLPQIEVALGTALLARSPKALLAAVALVLAQVANVELDVGFCTANEGVRVACQNYRTFERILREANGALEEIEKNN